MLRTSPPWIPSLSRHMSPSPVPWAYRLKLQGETQMPHSRCPAEQTSDGSAPAGKLQAWQASRVLLQMEALLLERRDRSRQANRLQLQEMIGRLEGLVLIAP
ncbi:hypothetical protein CRUP_008054 [Coryphaenoides rupestris]|nr:hypothetical protein CRUP_008054 [Coryphaenoides rupestris]